MALNSTLAPAIAPASARDTRALAQVWAQLKPDSCPEIYNFHMHTVNSDGQLPPHTLMEQTIDIGLRGLAITDHHTVQGYCTAQAWLDERKHWSNLPQLWTGVEISAQLLETEVHILGYGFEPSDARSPPTSTVTPPKVKPHKPNGLSPPSTQRGGWSFLPTPSATAYRRAT